jgi:chemotaxis methyl-accepting protein methylase
VGRDDPLDQAVGAILRLVERERGFRPEGYSQEFLEGRLRARAANAGAPDLDSYLLLLGSAGPELDRLVEGLTVQVSDFFRDPVAFEYLAEFVLPGLLSARGSAGGGGIRAWSAGCAAGEEPYSLAILLHDLAARLERSPGATIFATDVDERSLGKGREGVYPESALANVRQGLVPGSFRREGRLFRVAPEIARSVAFSRHDLLDPRTPVPSDSVFGTFDLVLCRNVLIYFEPESVHRVSERLFHSLADGGHLLLGRTESLPEPWSSRLRRVTDCCALYRKDPSVQIGSPR